MESIEEQSGCKREKKVQIMELKVLVEEVNDPQCFKEFFSRRYDLTFIRDWL